MKRVASVIGLKAENRDEYEELHRNVWPEVLKQISKSNLRQRIQSMKTEGFHSGKLSSCEYCFY